MKKQNTVKDMAFHAAIIGGAAFVYMSLFGHGLPTKLRGPVGRKLTKKTPTKKLPG